MGRILIYLLLALVAIFVVGRILIRFSDAQPARVGANLDCPDSPNCVSSAAAGDHAIAPLTFDGEAAAAQARLVAILQTMKRTTIETAEPNYVHATVHTAVWGFVDDMEFVIGDGRIDVRSASRMGYSDMGVNRNLVEAVRAEFDG